MKITHIRQDAHTTVHHVVTFCGAYDGSSISEFHARQIHIGAIPPPSPRSVSVCQACAQVIAAEAPHA